MVMFVTSDWHLKPGEEMPDMTSKYKGLIGVGDMLDLIPLGMKVWYTPEGERTCRSVARNMKKITAGNHDPKRNLRKLFKHFNISDVQVEDNFDINGWHIEHGHKLTEWWLLSIGADKVVEFMTGWNGTLRNWWYHFCIKKGWMPAKYMSDGVVKEYTESPYENVPLQIKTYWEICIFHAQWLEKNLIVGHSHHSYYTKWAEFKVIDLGKKKVVHIDNPLD